MRKLLCIAILAIVAVQFPSTAWSQGQKSLAASLGVQVFPSQGQSASVQSQDEAACYQWAVQNTGSDPFQLQKQQQAQQQQAATATQGSAVSGAARGAAGGALIGAMAGDAGKGAAIGAASGAVVNRSRARRASSQAVAGAQATQGQIDTFKKAFCACLEGKKYIAKY